MRVTDLILWNIFEHITKLRDYLREFDQNCTPFVEKEGYSNLSVSQDKTGASRFYGDGTGRRIISSMLQEG